MFVTLSGERNKLVARDSLNAADTYGDNRITLIVVGDARPHLQDRSIP